MLRDEFLAEFERMNGQGMAAKNAHDHALAEITFNAMDALAKEQGGEFEPKRLDALQPGARASWMLGNYDDSQEKLDTAMTIAEHHQLRDERGIITSNMGRLAATEVIRTAPDVRTEKTLLRKLALPYFRKAFEELRGNDHYYYRYADAGHGSLFSALAGKRLFASRLIVDGLSVAFRKSPEPYDQVRTFRLTKNALDRMAVAATLIPLGGRTPILADFARRKLVE